MSRRTGEIEERRKRSRKEGAMISFGMTNEEASIVQSVIERYLYHLQVEIAHTDKREYRDALRQREQFLMEIIDRLKTKILEAS
jgi:proline dehydrogenase